jgi:hypothetical protein
MARPVSMRANYRADGAYLLRLETALLKDRRRSVAWRTGSARMARRLALRLLGADIRIRAKAHVERMRELASPVK